MAEVIDTVNKIFEDKRKKELILFFVVFALVFVRYCYYGFEYFYQLDDYIQYHNYLIKYDGVLDTIRTVGLLAARPIAGCADLIIWSRFFSVMILAVGIISAMFAGAACIFRKIWEKHFGTGYLFLVVYTLLPVAFEGTYWVSASTRIVTGLFFAAICLWFFDKWCGEKKYRYLVLYIITQLIAYGLYEQVLVFSITSVVLVGILNLKNSEKRAWWGMFSFANAGVYFVFTTIFSESAVYANKGSLVLPISSYYWKTFLPNIIRQIKSVFVDGIFYTLARGFKRGIIILFSDFNFVYVVVILFFVACLFFLGRKCDKRKKSVLALVVGVLLMSAPVSPFLFLGNTWFSLRGIVTSLCGLALIADTLAGIVFSHLHSRETIISVLSVVLTLVCCVSSISEIHDYRETTITDQKITNLIVDTMDSDGLYGKSSMSIAVLNLEPTYLEHQNFYYHEHIHGVTEAQWSMIGAIECIGGLGYPKVTPVPSSPMYSEWNMQAMLLENFDVIYLYKNDKLIKLNIKRHTSTDRGYDLYSEDGQYFGCTWEEGTTGYLELE